MYPLAGVRQIGGLAGGGGDVDPYPGVTVYDQFTDTDATGLASHTPTKSPAQWVVENGATQITSNRAAWVSNGSPAFMLAHIASGLANCVISVIGKWTTVGANPGICFRVQDKNNCFIVFYSNNLFAIVRRLVGGVSVLASAVVATTTGTDHVIEVTLSGTSISATLDGGNLISATDTNFQAVKKHGLYAENNATFDEFQVV